MNWTKITPETMPPMDTAVWLVAPGRAPFIGCRWDEFEHGNSDSYHNWSWRHCHGDFILVDEQWMPEQKHELCPTPTHWMDLPQRPPQGQEGVAG